MAAAEEDNQRAPPVISALPVRESISLQWIRESTPAPYPPAGPLVCTSAVNRAFAVAPRGAVLRIPGRTRSQRVLPAAENPLR